MDIIVAGIHTGIGKTVCSAVICQALGYDYWKPVQAGELDNSDSIFIRQNVSNPGCVIHPETYRLTTPASPHYAAAEDGLMIQSADFVLPSTANNLLVETAGGIMSPLSDTLLNIDLMEQLQLPVVVVSNNYLGSINHTLLTLAALRQKNIRVKGLVFCGESVESTRTFILQYSNMPMLFEIPKFDVINPQVIAEYAQKVSINL